MQGTYEKLLFDLKNLIKLTMYLLAPIPKSKNLNNKNTKWGQNFLIFYVVINSDETVDTCKSKYVQRNM